VTQNPTFTAKMSKKQRDSSSSTPSDSKRKKTFRFNISKMFRNLALGSDERRKQNSRPNENPHETTV